MKYYIKKLIQFIGYNLTLPFIFLKYNQTPLSIYEKQEIEDSYLKFKKYFKNSLISNNDNEIRDHIIKSAIELSEENDYFLEFGVLLPKERFGLMLLRVLYDISSLTH